MMTCSLIIAVTLVDTQLIREVPERTVLLPKDEGIPFSLKTLQTDHYVDLSIIIGGCARSEVRLEKDH